MGKKTKQGKGRLDKFYHMAKEQGFRSRAAFKLIQLNKKYDFLSTCKCVVDLCAAPGGWLQVCAKYMPVASIKIGVDLDRIPAVKGCVTFQADITTPRCMALIRKELKHFKADLVLNDGAPNVGANWQMDAYNQVELSLHAMKIATETLRKGGIFITKVFRSKDYNSLLYVANQLFSKVESNKPQSSRSSSAEIFMVCQGFLAPEIIDPRLLDPKFALAEVENDPDAAASQATEKITSLKKLLSTKKNRGGYEEGLSTTLYAECNLEDFLTSAEPHKYLTSYNRFKINSEAQEMIKDLKPPSDIQFICDDLKVCGRREFQVLLRLRYRFQVEVMRKSKEIKEKARAEQVEKEEQDKTSEQMEIEVDLELEQTIKRMEKEKKRMAKKERELATKQEFRKKMSVIAATTLDNDEDLTLDRKTWEKLKTIDLEDLHKYVTIQDEESDLENMDPLERKFRFLADTSGKEKNQEQDDEDSDSSVDNKVKAVNKMAKELEESIAKEKEYKMVKSKKEVKREIKSKALIDQHRQRQEDVSDDEKLDNKDLLELGRKEQGAEDSDYSENDDDLEEERELDKIIKEQIRQKKQKKEDKKNETDLHDDEENSDYEKEEKQLFLNPLIAFKEAEKKIKKNKKPDQDSSTEWSDDDKYEPKLSKEEIRAKKDKERKVLGKRKRSGMAGEIDEVRDFFKGSEIQTVPLDDFEAKHKRRKHSDSDSELPEGYSSMDSDEIAETRALAKKMLRKKFRTEAIDASFSRNAFTEAEKDLPTWFVEDEAKHHVPNINLTKEEVDEEKRLLREWNARPSKKVMEAKAKKKMRLAKAMNKIKNKAQVIANQDQSEGSKMRQIQKLYTKERAKHKEEKKYVVNRTGNSSMNSRVPRGTKMVDSRMRKETRKLKQLKKNKKGGKKGRR